jgi:hypothetical protein
VDAWTRGLELSHSPTTGTAAFSATYCSLATNHQRDALKGDCDEYLCRDVQLKLGPLNPCNSDSATSGAEALQEGNAVRDYVHRGQKNLSHSEGEPKAPRPHRRRQRSRGARASTQGEWVASKRGTTYYRRGCKGANKLSAANRVIFKTEEEAQKAGYDRIGAEGVL